MLGKRFSCYLLTRQRQWIENDGVFSFVFLQMIGAKQPILLFTGTMSVSEYLYLAFWSPFDKMIFEEVSWL